MTALESRKDPAARYLFLGTAIGLMLFGLVMVYSASSASDFAKLGDSASHLKRQLLFIGMGIAALWACSRLSLDAIRRLGLVTLLVSDAGLVLVRIVGAAKWGATRWLDLGFFNWQPSESAKVGVIITVAALLADRQVRPRPLGQDVKALAWILVPVVLLVMLQPDMGTAMTVLVSVFLLLALGGVERRHLATLALGGALALPGLILAQSYRAQRFAAFLDPWADPTGDGYQSIQGLLAFGSGGLLGVGLGFSRQKFFYLPAAHTDFIFAIIGEELGLLGTLAVVLAFGLLAWSGLRLALTCRDRFGRLSIAGITVLIVVQAVMNMAAVTGLMPVTGIPMPLVSYGGSSMMFTLACVGLVLAIAGGGRARARVRKNVGNPEEMNVASASERRRDGRPRLSSIDGGRASTRRGA